MHLSNKRWLEHYMKYVEFIWFRTNEISNNANKLWTIQAVVSDDKNWQFATRPYSLVTRLMAHILTHQISVRVRHCLVGHFQVSLPGGKCDGQALRHVIRVLLWMSLIVTAYFNMTNLHVTIQMSARNPLVQTPLPQFPYWTGTLIWGSL